MHWWMLSLCCQMTTQPDTIKCLQRHVWGYSMWPLSAELLVYSHLFFFTALSSDRKWTIFTRGKQRSVNYCWSSNGWIARVYQFHTFSTIRCSLTTPDGLFNDNDDDDSLGKIVLWTSASALLRGIGILLLQDKDTSACSFEKTINWTADS